MISLAEKNYLRITRFLDIMSSNVVFWLEYLPLNAYNTSPYDTNYEENYAF